MKPLVDKIGTKKYMVFLDLEATQFSHEMIAIGAIKVTLNKDRTIKKTYPGFKRYVLAKEKIGDFVVNLTHITQKKLQQEGVHFGVMQEEFKKYVGKPFEKCVFVTFGSHDVRILNQTVQHNLSCDAAAVKTMVKNHFDFSEFLGEFIRDSHGNTYSQVNYLKIFGLEPVGEQHDALFDTQNLLRLYDAVTKNPKTLEENYKEQLAKKTHFPYPIQQVLKKIQNNQTVTPQDFDQFIKDYIEK